jgi:hypothetical protein
MTIHVEIATQQASFPSGTIAGAYRYHCTCSSVGYDALLESTNEYLDFTDATLPGTYTVTAQRYTNLGAPIGPVVTGQVTIPAGPDVTINVPVGITVVLQ